MSSLLEIPGPVEAGPTVPFAAWLAVQAAVVRMQGSPAADWLAGKIDELARTARFVGAQSPVEFDDRIGVLEEAIHDAGL